MSKSKGTYRGRNIARKPNPSEKKTGLKGESVPKGRERGRAAGKVPPAPTSGRKKAVVGWRTRWGAGGGGHLSENSERVRKAHLSAVLFSLQKIKLENRREDAAPCVHLGPRILKRPRPRASQIRATELNSFDSPCCEPLLWHRGGTSVT